MFAIKAARCFDGERFRPGGATVVVDGGRIAGVEPLGYDAPDGCEVTTYDGTLLPGLFDCHVHLVGDENPGSLERAGSATDDELDATIAGSLAQQARAGVTTVRDLGDTRYRTLVARDRRQPGVPRIVAAGPPLTVPNGHCHFLGGAVQGQPAIRAAVAEHADRGVDLIKVMASGGILTPGTDPLGVQFTPEELRDVVAAGHGAGLRVVAHCHSEAGARHALDAGVDGLEHFTCLTAGGVRVADDLIAALAERQVTVDPTLGFDPARVLPLDRAPEPVRALVERLGLTPVEVSLTRGGQLARLRELGARVVTGLDAGATPVKPHGDVWRGLVQLLDGGYTADEALATATSVAADDCGLGRTTGRLVPSYDADLLVVDGDLRTDLGALARPLRVVLRGAEPAAAG